LFGIVPEILVSAVADAVRGILPWDLAATGVLLTLIPIVSVAWAIRAIRQRRRGQGRPRLLARGARSDGARPAGDAVLLAVATLSAGYLASGAPEDCRRAIAVALDGAAL